MENRWHFTFVAKGWTIEAAFHYIGFGDHYESLEGGLRTFLLSFCESAANGYAVFLCEKSDKDEDMMYLFSEDACSAKRKIELVQAEGKL